MKKSFAVASQTEPVLRGVDNDNSKCKINFLSKIGGIRGKTNKKKIVWAIAELVVAAAGVLTLGF